MNFANDNSWTTDQESGKTKLKYMMQINHQDDDHSNAAIKNVPKA